jgi:hypothetical protein
MSLWTIPSSLDKPWLVSFETKNFEAPQTEIL